MKQTMQLLLLFVLITITGCSSDKKNVDFNTINYSETIIENENNFELSYNFQYLSDYPDKEVLTKIQTSMASDFFGEEFLKDTPQATAKNYTDFILSEFQAGIAEIQDEETEVYPWNWFQTITSEVNVIDEVILVYQIRNSYYMGGAHGMGTETYSNFDLKTGKKLTIDDLFSPEGKEVLKEKICEQILKENGFSDWDSLMDESCYISKEEIPIADNFILSKTDITFYYNPYDIACYAQGGTRVVLPIDNLVGFNNNIFKK